MALFGAAVTINGRAMRYEELFPFSMAGTESRITPEELRTLLINQDYEKNKSITIEEVEDIKKKVNDTDDFGHQPYYLAQYHAAYQDSMEFKEAWIKKYGEALRRERELQAKLKMMDQNDLVTVLLAKLWTSLKDDDIMKIIRHQRTLRGLPDAVRKSSARDDYQLPSRAFDRVKKHANGLYLQALFPEETVKDAWKSVAEQALGRKIVWELGTEHPFLMENFVKNPLGST
ncbi:MAG: hypothetical protein L6R40_000767 [Gallowayella cf. fulva]|nr:MAG: hypothetical protein L6R40_000767 [Xanthomendoza cf. fulva]